MKTCSDERASAVSFLSKTLKIQQGTKENRQTKLVIKNIRSFDMKKEKKTDKGENKDYALLRATNSGKFLKMYRKSARIKKQSSSIPRRKKEKKKETEVAIHVCLL